MTGQDIINNIRHHRTPAERIADKGLNFVCHCSNEISEGSSDNFFLSVMVFSLARNLVAMTFLHSN